MEKQFLCWNRACQEYLLQFKYNFLKNKSYVHGLNLNMYLIHQSHLKDIFLTSN